MSWGKYKWGYVDKWLKTNSKAIKKPFEFAIVRGNILDGTEYHKIPLGSIVRILSYSGEVCYVESKDIKQNIYMGDLIPC